VPVEDGVRFITQYDYETRWGAAGGALDRAAFRPLLGWATAWSFDRLRLWLEDGIPPEESLRRLLPHAGRCLRSPPRRFPLVFSGVAEVREWYDDEEQRFRISVEVGNARLGRLFGYRGWFHAEELPCAPSEVPARVKPVREEKRE
jgi:Domain of unknown function (DUF4166)